MLVHNVIPFVKTPMFIMQLTLALTLTLTLTVYAGSQRHHLRKDTHVHYAVEV